MPPGRDVVDDHEQAVAAGLSAHGKVMVVPQRQLGGEEQEIAAEQPCYTGPGMCRKEPVLPVRHVLSLDDARLTSTALFSIFPMRSKEHGRRMEEMTLAPSAANRRAEPQMNGPTDEVRALDSRQQPQGDPQTAAGTV